MKRSIDSNPRSRASVRDVAEAAGVSIGSVSRALHGGGYASTELKARVQAAAEALGYTRNESARHLRSNSSRTVGLLVSNIANPLVAAHFNAIEARLLAAGYLMLVGNTHNEPKRDAEWLKVFESRGLDGVLASPSVDLVDAATDPLRSCRMPIVVMDRDMRSKYDVVLMDHRSAVRQGVEYLHSLGHSRIALLGPGRDIRPGREKLQGYREGFERCGLAYDEALVCMFNSSITSAEEDMTRMLALQHPPTAMIGVGTPILSGALRAVRASGRSIPADMSVVGIGNDELSAFSYPQLTLLRFDIERSASAAAQLLLDRMRGTSTGPRTVTVALDLVLGASCSAPRQAPRPLASSSPRRQRPRSP